MPNETSLDSFVLRFIQETVPGGSPRPARAWHGIIHHVQTNTERHFTRWTDASAFIAGFVDLWEESGDGDLPSRSGTCD